MIGVEIAGVRPHGFSFAGGRAYVWAISSGLSLRYAIKIDLIGGRTIAEFRCQGDFLCAACDQRDADIRTD
ncbi:hypothetical protein [Bradyrhizobium valentinum]|nr:hypothetical protein [Bradyrhizobium valentinum]